MGAETGAYIYQYHAISLSECDFKMETDIFLYKVNITGNKFKEVHVIITANMVLNTHTCKN